MNFDLLTIINEQITNVNKPAPHSYIYIILFVSSSHTYKCYCQIHPPIIIINTYNQPTHDVQNLVSIILAHLKGQNQLRHQSLLHCRNPAPCDHVFRWCQHELPTDCEVPARVHTAVLAQCHRLTGVSYRAQYIYAFIVQVSRSSSRKPSPTIWDGWGCSHCAKVTSSQSPPASTPLRQSSSAPWPPSPPPWAWHSTPWPPNPTSPPSEIA